MSRESLSPSNAAPLSLFSPVTSGILCPISVGRCYVGITPVAGHSPESAQRSQPEMAPCCRPSPRDKRCLRNGAKVPGAAGMSGCGRREHPAATHRPACLLDRHPQPHGAGRSHWEQPCEEDLGENPSSCQAAHLPATLLCLQSHQSRENVAPCSSIFEQGASKTIICPGT